jgi:uncharacterized protein (DUF2252 family)
MAETPAPHPTALERVERGRAARSRLPRQRLSELGPASDRDPIALLEAQGASRVAELLPIRYGRMLASPFAFFRGAAVVMAGDLATLPRTGLRVQLCGDAHLLNFGGFASPERDLVFDVNDFDETLPGPFEWDVKRLATSVEIAARDRALNSRTCTAAVLATARGYRDTMQQLAGRRDLEVWYAHANAGTLLKELRGQNEAAAVREMRRETARAYASDTLRDLAKLTHEVDGEPRFISDPPLIVPVAELTEAGVDLEDRLRAIFRSYRRTLQTDRRQLLAGFRYADLAHKVVGIGSVGTQCWILLLLGKDERDPLFLQLKEAQASVLERLLGRSAAPNHGQRVVEGQRLSQAVSDIFLGWTRASDLDGSTRDFYVRQLRDWKVSVDLDRIRPRGLAIYGRWCGQTLARAHARSGDRIAIAAYLGKGEAFDKAVAAFASEYADLNEQDYALLRRAVDDGRLVAAEGT